jgi:type IV pilus assembly protein PilB
LGVEPFLRGRARDCVVAQRLARKLCGRCREVYEPTEAELLEAGYTESEVEGIEQLYRPAGCQNCGKTGYQGRMGLYEVMPVTEEIEQLAVERRSSEDIRRLAIEQGMITLREDGLEKVVTGMTSFEEIFRVVV